MHTKLLTPDVAPSKRDVPEARDLKRERSRRLEMNTKLVDYDKDDLLQYVGDGFFGQLFEAVA